MIYSGNNSKELSLKDISASAADNSAAEKESAVTVAPEEQPAEIHGIIRNERKWKRIATYLLVAFALAIVLFFIYKYVGYAPLASLMRSAGENINSSFLLFILAGFFCATGRRGGGYGIWPYQHQPADEHGCGTRSNQRQCAYG